ncbi:hypothetical protein BVX94_02820 [bacterium B17]|nr:hypothetical protein BVX94_02820 [bacterium B17]
MKTKTTKQNSGTIVTGLKRPNWICRLTRQIVILVRDVSGSMGGEKGRDANKACNNLVSELAQPINKDGFFVGVADFTSTAEIIHNLTPATELDGKISPLVAKDSTNITDGLAKALDLLEQPCGDGDVSFLRPVVILFTDGRANAGGSPGSVADEVKTQADLVTVAFGADADNDLLRNLASTPEHFYKVNDGRGLRSFLATVGATLTSTIARKTNATQALSQIQQ